MTSEVKGLNRISVGQLLYEDNEDDHHKFDYKTSVKVWGDNFIYSNFNSLKSKELSEDICTIKRSFSEKDTFSEEMVKIRKTSEDNASFNKGVEALELLRNVALDMFDSSGSNSRSNSDDLSDEFSENESKSASNEDDFYPYSPKDKKIRNKKLKVGHHHSKRRNRTTPEQLKRLEQVYSTEKMPNQELRESLALELNMTTRQVQIWFQNKRAKEKRSKLNEANEDHYTDGYQ